MKSTDERIPGMERYDYRSCDGGPHILLPLGVASRWKGDKINAFNPLDPKTDYGRACRIQGNWGLIDVAGSAALVLANPPMSATASASGTNALDIVDIFVLQAWESEDLDALLDRAATRTPSASFTNTGAIMKFDNKGAALLFAGDKPGDAIYGESHVFVAGEYMLFTAHYKGMGVEAVDIYRLKRRGR